MYVKTYMEILAYLELCNNDSAVCKSFNSGDCSSLYSWVIDNLILVFGTQFAPYFGHILLWIQSFNVVADYVAFSPFQKSI